MTRAVGVLVVQQAMKTETIPFLVGLLETGLEAVDNMAATKAQIVKALKAMQLSMKYGEQVTVQWRQRELKVGRDEPREPTVRLPD